MDAPPKPEGVTYENQEKFLAEILGDPLISEMIVFRRTVPGREAVYAETETPLPAEITTGLGCLNIEALYAHQARALDALRKDVHSAVCASTSGGKTLIYNIAVLEKLIIEPDATALYLFPLKALAMDQLKTFRRLVSHVCPLTNINAFVYDGDVKATERLKIRQANPNVIMTNPEMLNFSILGMHEKWAHFLRKLRFVVIDEAHGYRGVMGSNMAWVFRRLVRLCNRYGAAPTFVFTSATIKNPKELAKLLTGLEVEVMADDCSPAGRRHFIFINPKVSPSSSAVSLIRKAAKHDLRTIVFTGSRKATELLSLWSQSKDKPGGSRISSYRSGFLPRERRKIEDGLASGELLTVVSTSALELGIDIGGLEVCILVGYPGSIISGLQRSGRVGRDGRDSTVVLIGAENALDQYFMRNPEEFFTKGPEAAILNPYNPKIMEAHLLCAAKESPLAGDEIIGMGDNARAVVDKLHEDGRLFERPSSGEYYTSLAYPQGDVDLRGCGRSFRILNAEDNKQIGSIDGYRVLKETHPGAVYIHSGKTWVVNEVDFENCTVKADLKKPNYYTRPMSSKTTEIIEVMDERVLWGTRVYFGELRVTERVEGYEKRLVRGQKLIGIEPLDLPPLVLETEGLWITIPEGVQSQVVAAYLHFMGGIHALEHAMIGMCPLLILADRDDLGGISTPMHPALMQAGIFIYDGVSGGAGLAKAAFRDMEKLLESTKKALSDCPCEDGCPSCIHSPKCGSGNRPLDKVAAILILDLLKNGVGDVQPTRTPRQVAMAAAREEVVAEVKRPEKEIRFGVFDLETQLSAFEVGGWRNTRLMRVSCLVLFDSLSGEFLEYEEKDLDRFFEIVPEFDLVVGFNVKRFDYNVLAGYTDMNFREVPTLDLLEYIERKLKYRVSLNNVAQATLGAKKSADGLQALRWWKLGRIREIIDYCRQDVAVTLGVYDYGRKNGRVFFTNKAGNKVAVDVNW